MAAKVILVVLAAFCIAQIAAAATVGSASGSGGNAFTDIMQRLRRIGDRAAADSEVKSIATVGSDTCLKELETIAKYLDKLYGVTKKCLVTRAEKLTKAVAAVVKAWTKVAEAGAEWIATLVDCRAKIEFFEVVDCLLEDMPSKAEKLVGLVFSELLKELDVDIDFGTLVPTTGLCFAEGVAAADFEEVAEIVENGFSCLKSLV